MERNPHHPTTNAIRDHWHKLAAALLIKYGGTVVLTEADLKRLEGANIVVRDDKEGIRMYIVDDAEAERLAKLHGGVYNN